MSDKFPYASSPGHISQMIAHLRRSFPTTVTSETLKKLGVAPNHETRVLNVLKFIGTIDQEGNRTEAGGRVFSIHDDPGFFDEFGKLVQNAYSDLFSLHGETSWNLDKSTLISFFRASDQTSEHIGGLQASTFQSLSTLAGHENGQEQKASTSKIANRGTRTKIAEDGNSAPKQKTRTNNKQADGGTSLSNIGLTVRIEINLPADGDQKTYDTIFKSIRDNLLNG